MAMAPRPGAFALPLAELAESAKKRMQAVLLCVLCELCESVCAAAPRDRKFADTGKNLKKLALPRRAWRISVLRPPAKTLGGL